MDRVRMRQIKIFSERLLRRRERRLRKVLRVEERLRFEEDRRGEEDIDVFGTYHRKTDFRTSHFRSVDVVADAKTDDGSDRGDVVADVIIVLSRQKTKERLRLGRSLSLVRTLFGLRSSRLLRIRDETVLRIEDLVRMEKRGVSQEMTYGGGAYDRGDPTYFAPVENLEEWSSEEKELLEEFEDFEYLDEKTPYFLREMESRADALRATLMRREPFFPRPKRPPVEKSLVGEERSKSITMSFLTFVKMMREWLEREIRTSEEQLKAVRTMRF